jgi:hypothetical protein
MNPTDCLRAQSSHPKLVQENGKPGVEFNYNQFGEIVWGKGNHKER